MNLQQLKEMNELTSAECDALLKLNLSTPNRITDKYSDDFDVNFRKIRHKLGRLADIADGETGYVVKGGKSTITQEMVDASLKTPMWYEKGGESK